MEAIRRLRKSRGTFKKLGTKNSDGRRGNLPVVYQARGKGAKITGVEGKNGRVTIPDL